MITLDESRLFREGSETYLSLPVVLDLKGVPYERDPTFCDHYWYNNDAGSLYVRCDNRACFEPSMPKEEWDKPTLQLPFYFGSRFSLPIDHNRFVFDVTREDVQEQIDQFAEQVIYEEGPINRFTLEFMKWIDLFFQEHGEKHYYERNWPSLGSLLRSSA